MLSSLLNRRSTLVAAALLACGSAWAQAWPTKPIRAVVPFAAGSATDQIGRAFAEKMQAMLGQPVVVDNKPGASGMLGAAEVAKAAPDGYTILIGTNSTNAALKFLMKSLPYDQETAFTPVGFMGSVPLIVGVNNDVPARTVPELIELCRRNPGRYSFASSGSGTTVHLSGEMFKQLAGIDILHVPYRGGAPANVDLLAGRVHMMFDNIPQALAHHRDGKMRALAVTGAERSPQAPEIPTMAEFLPGFDMTSWTCSCGPAAVPRAVVARMSELTRKALESPDLVRSFRDNGAEPFVTTPEEITAYRAAEQARLAPLIRASGARVD